MQTEAIYTANKQTIANKSINRSISTILLTTELILLYLTQSYVFCQQPKTQKRIFAKAVLYLEMLRCSWSITLPNSTILLPTKLILLHLTQFHFFCHKPETRKDTFAKVVLFLERLSRSWSTTLPSSTILLSKELILLYLSFASSRKQEKALPKRSEH